MDVITTIICGHCGKSFNLKMYIGPADWTEFARDEIEIYKTTITPLGDPDYVRNNWDCPICSVLKKRKDVKAWLCG